ncbi:hypothetical protein IFM89_027949 [Coptis chinensis]|uniref:Pentatricopeptide repeat-containing protein n=1 Tax=Coptis chinensis TaxID=261450 RepID=A0A835IBS4_9MAGN|nr:hypothetical protein IFM89_027949 [Coptis chinensis]
MNQQINRFISNASSTLSVAISEVQNLVSKGLFQQALEFYRKEVHPCQFHEKHFILPSVIKACSTAQFLHFGIQLHCMVLKTGSVLDIVIANSLISMYAKCSSTETASQLFDAMPVRDMVTWNSIITCYVQNGYVTEAITKFKQMCSYSIHPKPELIASILSVCGRTGNLRLGKEIHARAVSNGEINQCTFTSTALIDMYSKCFDSKAGYQIFECMKQRNEVSWTAMITGCTTNERYSISLDLFRAMLVEGFRPNRVTLIAVLPACAELSYLKHGKQIHGYAIRSHCESESRLAAALIDMYCKCEGTQGAATLIFETSQRRDVVMWSSMIGSYSKNGDSANAIKLFNQMRMEGINPNSITLLAIIIPHSVNHGRAVHGYILKTGFGSDTYVGNSLIDMYAKCGHLNASHQIFKEIPIRDSVSWSALIRAHGLYGYSAEALQLFNQMLEEDIEPDNITFLAILSACSHGGFIEQACKLFEQIQQDNRIDLTLEHYACYIDLLGRSGNVENAYTIITGMPYKPSPAIWSSLVSACKTHGRLDVAKQLVHRLIASEPDNPASYMLSRMVYAENGDWYGAEEVQKVMRKRGLTKSSGYSQLEPEFCC